MKNLKKKLKFTNKLKRLGPNFKWLLFTSKQDYKLGSQYLKLMYPDLDEKNVASVELLRDMVKNSLLREFSPEVEGSRSFELLIDAVMHRIQKKTFNVKELVELDELDSSDSK